MDESYDVVVVGGSAAGLSGAVALARSAVRSWWSTRGTRAPLINYDLILEETGHAAGERHTTAGQAA